MAPSNDRQSKEEKVAVPFYADGVAIYLSLKVSKDRGSRKEDVEVLKAPADEERGRNVGWRVFKRVFGGKESDDGSGKPE